MAARRGVSFTHASFAPQPETVPPAAALPQPAAAAPATGAMRWQDRAKAHSQLAVSLPQAGAPDHVVPEPQGPWMHGPGGLAYSHGAPGGPTPVGMHHLGVEPADADEGKGYDSDEADKEFDEKLAVDRAAYFAGDVVAAAPAVGGRACGVGQSAFASYVPKWLLCGAYPPAGFHTEWGIPLERARERFVAGGASHYPNPPIDNAPPPQLDDLADFLTVALDPDILAAYQRGFLAALRLRDSPQEVPGAGGTAAGDALRTVVPPSGGEIYELTDEDYVPEDEDEAATVDAEADSEHFEI
ncbi:hypothetical protein CYMTET_16222 [Cymbomonas tetramitiformis]|uniref:Uncharacterized protein n=1 Tax=Cymbomonas tetramitiformis TaxID=36881 RepID=A0AAE0L8H1_9CHLO|nr:hypothetical protein CYMTET_16222 [Cymbomonas tetramitiformis]